MIDEIVSRLAAAKDSLGLKLVEGVASFQAAYENAPPATPAAYVVLAEEVPGPNPWSGEVLQQTRIVAGVCFTLANVADPRGAAAAHDLKALRLAVKNSLLGWSPATGYDPLERGRCHLLGFRPGGLMWWQDTYYSTYIDRSAQ